MENRNERLIRKIAIGSAIMAFLAIVTFIGVLVLAGIYLIEKIG